MKTIDDVIRSEEKEAERLEEEVVKGVAYKYQLGSFGELAKVDTSKENTEKAKEHRQIAEWLKAYKELTKPTGTYECFHCGHRTVVWGSDFDFSDYGYEGEGIVHTCTCANCGAEIEYRVSLGDTEDV